jgi:integrase
MTIARGFARYLAGIDARTEVPPPGLIAAPQRWRPPFIYSSDDIAMLLAQARRLRQPMPAATHETLVGLLAVTGVRVGEALRLDRGDIDWACGVLAIRESKFGKSRRVPVLQSTLAALDSYAQIRDQFCTQATSSSFLLSTIERETDLQAVVHQRGDRRRCRLPTADTRLCRPPRYADLGAVVLVA